MLTSTDDKSEKVFISLRDRAGKESRNIFPWPHSLFSAFFLVKFVFQSTEGNTAHPWNCLGSWGCFCDYHGKP
jgi:hypothetical protein